MGTKIKLVISLPLLFLTSSLSAQRLKIIDSALHTPLPLATVVEISVTDGTIVTSGSTDNLGYYISEAVSTRKRLVSITAIGYKKKRFSFPSRDTTISLSPEIKQLQNVTVRARPLPLKITGNKIEYDISQVPHADYLTTAAIIDQLPFLQIDENQVKMMNENITILVDGKNNSILSTVDGLKSLPPQAIQKIELTLVPTARGNGGKVLNIMLKKDYFLGFNGSEDLNVNAFGGGSRTSFTYWHKKYGFDGSASYNQFFQKVETTTSIANRIERSSVSAQNKATNRNHAGGIFLSGFYNTDSLSTLDLQVSLSPSLMTRAESGIKVTTDSLTSEKSANLYALRNPNLSAFISLNYTKKSHKEGNAFYFLTYISFLQPRQQYNLQNLDTDQNEFEDQYLNNKGRNNEQTLEAILQQNSAKTFKYTIGTKVISRQNFNEYDITSFDTAFRTLFKMNQLVSSTYADADFSFRKLIFHPALRLDYNHNSFTEPTILRQEALNFVPNFSLSYNMNRANFFTVNYFRSLSRPGSYQYSPVTTPASPYQRDAGNLQLNNEITNSWSANYMGNFSFARLGLNFRYADISGLLREVSSVNTDNIVISTPVNVDLYHSYTIGLFADFQLFKKLRISHNSSGSLLHQSFAGRSISQWSGYLTERLYLEINKKSMLGFNLTRYSPNLLPQGKEQSLAYTKMDLNYSYFFDFGKNLPASLAVTLTNPNLWNGYRSYTEVSSPELFYREDRLRKNSIVTVNFRISLRGKQYGNKTFNKEKNIQNSDLHTSNN